MSNNYNKNKKNLKKQQKRRMSFDSSPTLFHFIRVNFICLQNSIRDKIKIHSSLFFSTKKSDNVF